MFVYLVLGDERFWLFYVLIVICFICVNLVFCVLFLFEYFFVYVIFEEINEFFVSIDVFNNVVNDGGVMIQVDGLIIKFFVLVIEVDDYCLFFYIKWDVVLLQGDFIIKGIEFIQDEVELVVVCERVLFYYLRCWKEEFSDEEWVNGQVYYVLLRDFMNYVFGEVEKGCYFCVKKEWLNDSDEEVKDLIKR